MKTIILFLLLFNIAFTQGMRSLAEKTKHDVDLLLRDREAIIIERTSYRSDTLKYKNIREVSIVTIKKSLTLYLKRAEGIRYVIDNKYILQPKNYRGKIAKFVEGKLLGIFIYPFDDVIKFLYGKDLKKFIEIDNEKNLSAF